ncbi:hypothetical protein NP233_g8778 [Leucocoprinus birnbaumii]|uniref:BTB domain-containing protein n=1 Tax=Leucocoprinus birnbaumii TaxID=56174 RepID=A0AAD5VLW7_9AGAR|nr:hypothetical protein NP233_g8778 [Leucocoprinus birnbaumii]
MTTKPNLNSPTTRMLKHLKEHPVYYHLGGDLTLIVDDTSFRIASIFFARESEVFKDRLSEDLTKTTGPDRNKGKNVTDPDATTNHTIVIEAHEGVSPDDLAELCSIFYNPRFSIYEKSLDSWKTILRLANQWSFNEVKALAFRELENTDKFPIPLVDRIVLYQLYNADKSYLEPLYEKLILRREPLTEQEGEALGMRCTIRISHVRQEMLHAMLPEGATTEPLPTKIKDSITKAVRLIASSSTAPPSTSNGSGKLTVDTRNGSGSGTSPTTSTSNANGTADSTGELPEYADSYPVIRSLYVSNVD